MANIISKEKCIVIDGASLPLNSMMCNEIGNGAMLTIIGGSGVIKLMVSETTIDGVAVTDRAQLIAFLQDNCFSIKGGGSGGDGAVDSVTGNLVTGTSTNPIVDLPTWVDLLRDDRVGYLNSTTGMTFQLSGISDAVKFLSPIPLEVLNLKYPTLTDKIKKVTLIFNCDVNLINNSALTNAFLRNIPTKAKQYDCWTLMYDSGDRVWDFISVNTMPKWYIDEAVGESGTDRQVQGFIGGKRVPVTLGWKQLSDLPSPPPFLNGVLIGTAFKENGDAVFGFLEMALSGVESFVLPNGFPVYNPGIIGNGGGTLPVADAIKNGDAVNKGQSANLLKLLQGYNPSVDQMLVQVGGVLQWTTWTH